MAPSGVTATLAPPVESAARRATASAVRLLFALLVSLPLYGWLFSDNTIAGRLVVVGLFALSLARPAHGLAVLAGLLIMGAPLGALLGSVAGFEEAMALAFIAAWLLHDTLRRRTLPPYAIPLVTPAWLFGTVVAASALVQVLAAQSLEAPFGEYLRQSFISLSRDYFASPGGLPGLGAAAPTLEGIALFTAIVAIVREREVGERVLRMMVAGATGLAALNLVRFVSIALRTGLPFAGAVHTARAVRISVLGDFNAIGSYLAMMLFVGLGFALASRRGRLGWLVSAAVIFASLWLTQSRAALLSVPFGLLVFPALLIGRAHLRAWWKPLLGWSAALVVVVLLVARFLPPDAGVRPAVNMLQGRLEMARVSVQMFATEPIFGAGVGRFFPLSARYIRPEANTAVTRENAHNNFLQVLAELGIVGLLTFAWALVVVGLCLRAATAARRDVLLVSVSAALLAFLLTCLSGHPLLVRHVCYAFWLMLGTAVAISCAGSAGQASAETVRPLRAPEFRIRWLAGALAAVVILSVPVRGERLLRKEADLEHVSSGFSEWVDGAEGRRYRVVNGTGKMYVHRDVCQVLIPLRADGPSRTDVELRLDGRVANRVLAPATTWSSVSMLVPRSATRDRFHTLQIRPLTPGAGVRVGAIEAPRCGR